MLRAGLDYAPLGPRCARCRKGSDEKIENAQPLREAFSIFSSLPFLPRRPPAGVPSGSQL